MKERFKQFLYANDAYDKYKKALWKHHTVTVDTELGKWPDNEMEMIIQYSISWRGDEDYWERLNEQWIATFRVVGKRAKRMQEHIAAGRIEKPNPIFEL